MERRIERIRRWLDRCTAACEGRLWAAAIAELDCARAEMEETRRALSDRLLGEPSRRTGASRATLRVALTSLLLVALLSHPAGSPRGPERSLSPLFTASGSMVEIVTPDEKRLLDALRMPGGGPALAEVPPERIEAAEARRLPDEGLAPAVGEKRFAPTDTRFVRAGGGAVEESVPSQSPSRRDPVVALKADDEPTAEDLLRLLQVGQRALRDEGVVVVQ
ncbi:hypothetical protein [Aminirod propionatiphilus]|uniref:Uncharacterized protein n=1 Tax=Aminirod propionatiphilus TaxID=3415223 RepID=A0ACD1DTI4_9BACT|nr:hypothetical protein KIH16_09545 [Synergistota bacterium]